MLAKPHFQTEESESSIIETDLLIDISFAYQKLNIDVEVILIFEYCLSTQKEITKASALLSKKEDVMSAKVEEVNELIKIKSDAKLARRYIIFSNLQLNTIVQNYYSVKESTIWNNLRNCIQKLHLTCTPYMIDDCTIFINITRMYCKLKICIEVLGQIFFILPSNLSLTETS